MMMSAISDWAVGNLAVYGLPVLLALAFVGSLGIPFPVTLVIMAAGAMSRTGVFDWRLALAACVAGAMLADHSEYLLGRLAKNKVERRFGQNSLWKRGLDMFRRQGGWAILLTRFWLMPVAPAINLIAGSQYPYQRFLALDLAGQTLWVLIYGGLGYLFASQWQAVNGLSWASMALAGLGFGYFCLARANGHNARG